MKMVQDIEANFASSNNGTFGSILEYLDQYRYYPQTEAVARRVVRGELEQLLQHNEYVLAHEEAEQFLIVCRKLFCGGVLGWTELQSYISKVKEANLNDPGNDPAK